MFASMNTHLLESDAMGSPRKPHGGCHSSAPPLSVQSDPTLLTQVRDEVGLTCAQPFSAAPPLPSAVRFNQVQPHRKPLNFFGGCAAISASEYYQYQAAAAHRFPA